MSRLLAHRGMMLSGLRLSDGLYGFLPDLNAGAFGRVVRAGTTLLVGA